jgi:hypothetical protein
MSTKRTLGNTPVFCARKGQSHMLQVVHGLDSFAAHKLDSILIAQVIAAFDGVVGMPFRVIFFQIPKRCTDTSLGRASVRAGRVQLAENSCFCRAGCE